MNRRALFRVLATLPGLVPALALGASLRREAGVLLQVSPVAGFQYHEGAKLWRRLRYSDALALRREARNPHDERAVAVYWHDRKLGYVPRRENAAIAQMLDRGLSLRARVERLAESDNPWERVRFSISLA